MNGYEKLKIFLLEKNPFVNLGKEFLVLFQVIGSFRSYYALSFVDKFGKEIYTHLC